MTKNKTAGLKSSWGFQVAHGVLIKLHIQPKAARSEISGEFGSGDSVRLKIRIAAQPMDGAANKELIAFLKKITGISSARIHLIRGEASKAKDVLFEDALLGEILQKLSAEISGTKKSA